MAKNFLDIGVPDVLVETLKQQGIENPFAIQSGTIPDTLANRDICGRAPTGSGKTIAFGIPLVIMTPKGYPNEPRSLILAPTRELAEQITVALRPLARRMGKSILSIYGGVNMRRQIDRLSKGVDIIVACPGRLNDLLEQKALTLEKVNRVVIDEADRMADMGFLPQVRKLLDQTSEKRQTILFSATLDGEVAVLTREYQVNPVRHEFGSDQPDIHSMEHKFWSVDRPNRVPITVNIIERYGRTIIFTRTKHGADRAVRQLKKVGTSAAAIHGDRSQHQRRRALTEFSEGKIQALVATDVAARGIHVDGIECVLHFDPPQDSKTYVHRSGRTARAGATGVVICFVDQVQHKIVKQLQKAIGLSLPITTPEMSEGLTTSKPPNGSGRSRLATNATELDNSPSRPRRRTRAIPTNRSDPKSRRNASKSVESIDSGEQSTRTNQSSKRRSSQPPPTGRAGYGKRLKRKAKPSAKSKKRRNRPEVTVFS